MNTIALQLASASALTTLVTWAVYFAKVPGGDVPARPVGSIAAQVLSLVLAVAAVGLQAQHGGVTDLGALIGVTIPAGFGAMMAALFLYLLTQRRTPLGELRVAVGDKLLPFEATTATGAAFHSDALLGKRTLLKFFRGGW